MAERDVTLNLGVNLKGGADPLKRTADTLKMMADTEERWVKARKEGLEALRSAGMFEKEAGHRRKEALTEEEKHNKLVRERVDSLREQIKLRKDVLKLAQEEGVIKKPGMVQQLGGVAQTFGLGGMVGTGGAISAAVAIAKEVGNMLPGSKPTDYDEGRESKVLYRRRMEKEYEEGWKSYIPGVSAFSAEYTRRHDIHAGERHLSEAEKVRQRAEQDVTLKGPLQDRLRMLEAQKFAAMGSYFYDRGSAAVTQFGISRGATAYSEAAQASLFGRNTYDRTTQQADVARQIQFQAQQQSYKVEAQRQMGAVELKELNAGAEVDALRKQLAEAGGNVAGARRNLERPFTENEGATASEQRNIARNQLIAAQIRQEEIRRQLMAAEEHSLSVQQEKTQVIAGNAERMQQLYKNQLSSLDAIVQQERARRQALTESVGLAMPHEQMRLLHTARKVHAGGPLNLGDIQYMKQHADIFGPQLQKIGAARGGPLMAELQRLLPHLTAREKSAEAMRVKIASELKIHLTADAKTITDHINKSILPAFDKIGEQIIRELMAKIEKQNLLRKIAMGGAAGGAR